MGTNGGAREGASHKDDKKAARKVVQSVLAESEYWGCAFMSEAGVVLYSTSRIRDVALVESVSRDGESSRLQTLRVFFRENRFNPSTAGWE